MKLETLPREKGPYNLEDYDALYESFRWEDVEEHFTWSKTGKVNIAYEAIDRHTEGGRKNKVALFYRDEACKEKYTFQELKEWSNRAGNVFKECGVKKGDIVFFFMPRIPELYFSIAGAVKIGAIVGTLFDSFMKDALRERLRDSGAKYLVTTRELLERIPEADLKQISTIFLFDHTKEESDRYVDFSKRIKSASKQLSITWVDREDGLFLQYTSGSTGTPKGVLHVHDAMRHYYVTARWVLDLREEDVYWCTADPGWITGAVYGMFAPWLMGTSICVLGGRFDPDVWYRTIEEFDVTVLYTAPTALRMLMGAGDEAIREFDLSSLRHILTVGERLDPDIIRWGLDVFGLRIHDTWWMTETGGIMISNFPALEIRPGSMGKPIPGVRIAIVNQEGQELPPYHTGNLVIRPPWPGMMRAIWNNRQQYEAYFLPNGWFLTEDLAYMDEDGYIWYQGRSYDEILTSGERLGPFEVERKLMEHPAVKEAGVVGVPDQVKGEKVKAFIVLNEGFDANESLKEELNRFIKENLAKNTELEEIEFLQELPKTRSGKIMRRALKTIK